MKRLLFIGVTATILLAGCDGGTGTPDVSRGSPDATPSPVAPSSPTPEETPDNAFVRCQNPEGFALHYPEDWHTNPADVVPRCSQFDPEPFEVPRATDERVAAITAYIDPVPFERVAAPQPRRDAERRELTIDGRPAVRLEYVAAGTSLWPEGTPITLYAIELPPSDEGRPRTLFVDTIGLEPFDYERNQGILDRIAPDLDLAA